MNHETKRSPLWQQGTRLAGGLGSALLVATVMSGKPVHAQNADTDSKPEEELSLPTIEVGADEAQDSYINLDESARAGKTSVSVQDTPRSITVVEEPFFRDTGAKNVEDALQYSSGIQAARYGFDTRLDSVAVRGLAASSYVDGLRSLYGYYNSVRPNIYALESIEVLKGPSSVLYGQAELGGIVNAVSKLPKEQQQGELWSQVGSYDRVQVATDVTGPVDEDGNLLYRLVALKRETGTQVDYVENNGHVLAPSLTWKPADGTELTLLVNRQINQGAVSAQFLPQEGTLDSGPKGQIPTDTFVGEPGWDRYDRKKTEVTLFFDQRISRDWTLKAVARKTDTKTETREHWTTVGASPDSDGNIPRTIHTADRATDIFNFDIRTEGLFSIGPTQHTLAVGVDRQDALWEQEYLAYGNGGTINVYDPEYGNINDDALNPQDGTDNKIEQTGVYVIDHIDIGRTVVSAALRRDESTSTEINPGAADETSNDTATTGRLGLMYRFAMGLSPFISYSESFKPNLGVTQEGNSLDATTGNQVEVGAKYLSPLGDLAVDFAWFDIEEENHVAQGNVPGSVTQTGATVQGWEVQVKKRMAGLEVLANFTRLDTEDEQTNERLSNVAETIASVWGKYELANGLRAGLGGRYRGDVVGSGGGPKVPSVYLYDAMVGYQVDSWDLSLNVQNIADKTYVAWCRGPGQDCGYGERRNILGNVRYRF